MFLKAKIKAIGAMQRWVEQRDGRERRRVWMMLEVREGDEYNYFCCHVDNEEIDRAGTLWPGDMIGVRAWFYTTRSRSGTTEQRISLYDIRPLGVPDARQTEMDFG